MNDQEGVELSQGELDVVMRLIKSKDRAGIQRILDQHKVTSIQYLLWAKESVIFHTTFGSIMWLNSPDDFDINIRNTIGQTLLFNIWRGPLILGNLLNRNIDVNIRDKSGMSAVMFYAKFGYKYHIVELLDRGASLKEAREGYGKYVHTSKSDMLDRFKRYEEKETSCRKSVVGFTLLGKTCKGLIHKDLIPVVATLMWATRRREEWSKNE